MSGTPFKWRAPRLDAGHPRKRREKLKVLIERSLWNKAKAQARTEHMTVSWWIRRLIQRALGLEEQ
jgi:hypothetical protein